MRYVAQLSRDNSEILNGEKLFLTSRVFDARDDSDAINQAVEWGARELDQMAEMTVHLELVQEHRGVHFRTFGDQH